MSTQHTLHQIKLQQWASVLREQASRGMTAKAWCQNNNLSIHAYNYWKRLLKEEYLESAIIERKYKVNLFEYFRAADPPVRCGESHLSGLAEPPVIYSYCI